MNSNSTEKIHLSVLYLTLYTVRTHVQSMDRKLNVCINFTAVKRLEFKALQMQTQNLHKEKTNIPQNIHITRSFGARLCHTLYLCNKTEQPYWGKLQVTKRLRFFLAKCIIYWLLHVSDHITNNPSSHQKSGATKRFLKPQGLVPKPLKLNNMN